MKYFNSDEDEVQLQNDILTLRLGGIPESLRKWYEYSVQGDWDYVVFIVERGYMLTLILERGSDAKLDESEKTYFLTDSSLLIHAEEIATRYRSTGIFPSILIVDDLIVHGRGLNHLIYSFENELCRCLPEMNGRAIHRLLGKNIYLNVFARSNNILLDLNYEENINWGYSVEVSVGNQLSAIFSEMILDYDIANTCCVYSEYLSDQAFDRIDLSNFVKTTYRNVDQYCRVWYAGLGMQKKAAFTIRIVKNRKDPGYRVIPFVFLPNMSDAETFLLNNFLAESMEEKLFFECSERLKELYKLNGKRNFNELVLLILSLSVLHEFNDNYNLAQLRSEDSEVDYNEKTEEELRKLARNYKMGGEDETIHFLTQLISSSWVKFKDLIDQLETIIPDESWVLTQNSSLKEIKKHDCVQLRREMEYCLYQQALREEREALILEKDSNFRSIQRMARYVIPSWTLLREFSNMNAGRMTEHMISYYLQLMDTDVLNVSLFASNDIQVTGFVEYAKTGKTSQFVSILRIYEWMLMLEEMERYCIGKCKNFDEEIRSFSEYIDDPNFTRSIPEICRVREELAGCGQLFRDWVGSYYSEIDLPEEAEEDREVWVYNFLLRRKNHYKKYKEYCRRHKSDRD